MTPPVSPNISVANSPLPEKRRRDDEEDERSMASDESGAYEPTEYDGEDRVMPAAKDQEPHMEDGDLFGDSPEEADPGSSKPNPRPLGDSEQVPVHSGTNPWACPPCDNERIPKRLSSPIKPSAEDVDRHNCTHLPYRNWCPVCVKAKGREDDHRRGAHHEEDASGLPIVSLDYQTLNGDGDKGTKVIIGKDESTGNVLGHSVICKGLADEWVIKRIVKDMEELGLGHAIVKTDGEPAIVAVQNRIQALRPGRTVPRNPPAYNPQSNGPCEKAVQDVSAQLRVLILALEARLDTTIADDLPIVQWALEHAVFLLNKFNVGEDGMAAYERQTGRKWRRAIVEFGELVLAKLALRRAQKGVKKKQRRKLAPRSIEGIWVGQIARSGEHIIIKPSGDAVRCRTIKRVPVQHRWNAEKVLLIRATPRIPSPSSAHPEAISSRLVDEEAKEAKGAVERASVPEPAEDRAELAEARQREFGSREFRINDRILEKYGVTEGCPGCTHKTSGLPGHLGHSVECRERLRQDMSRDAGDKRVLDSAQRRLARPRDATIEAASDQVATSPEGDRKQPDTPRFGRADEPNIDNSANDTGHNDNQEDDAMPELGFESDDSDMEIDLEGEVSRGEDPLADLKRSFDNEDDDDDDEPRGKKQRVKSIVPRPSPITSIGKSMCNITRTRSEVPSILAAELKEAKQNVNIREIIQQLEKDPRLRIPENRRQRRTATQAACESRKMDVAEVYSPPRITAMARTMGLKDGWALDLTEVDPDDGEPWDLSRKDKREKAKKKIDEDKPFMLILSPMCGPFSRLQELFNYPKQDTEQVKEKIHAALDHLKFAIELCIKQKDQGRMFIFEHPVNATSWYAQTVRLLSSMDGVYLAKFDFCMAGMKTIDGAGREAFAKKRTGVLTNSSAVASLLRGAQCRGEHKHEPLLEGRAGPCQQYPDKFCRLICEGIKKELSTVEWKNRMQKQFDISTPFGRVMAIQQRIELATPPEEDPFSALYEDCEFIDDTTGVPLDKELAIQARRLEIEYFRKMGVYTKVKREPWMKVITTRWLDTNKGDETSPSYRARLVGRELKRDRRDDLFAATPPLESLRMIMSICASNQREYQREKNFIVMTNDIKRAYFYAPATRPIFIKIPDEDWEDGDSERVGQLNLSLYGTRDAALNWSKTYSDALRTLGFTKGRASPCNFFHPSRRISVTVHGDDFTSTGQEVDLRWLDRQLRTKFDVKTEFLGPGESHAKQVRVLNRVLTWEAEGLTYESDQRHAEIIIQAMNVTKAVTTPGSRDDAQQAGPPNTTNTTITSTPPRYHNDNHDSTTQQATHGHDTALQQTTQGHQNLIQGPGETPRRSTVSTLTVADEPQQIQGLKSPGETLRRPTVSSMTVANEPPLPMQEASVFRALAARANYLAQDRPDVQYAVKEIARRMASPTGRDWALLKRLARYLLGAPRGILHFYWQDVPTQFDVFVDSDWAGCKATGRSTSGGAARFGWHTIKSWSTTQTVVALSSGEAELYSLTKGAAQTLGLMSLARDLGVTASGRLHTDANAALGIIQREGLGKLRHLNVQYLWIQDRIRGGELQACKVPGRNNPADLMTKHVPAVDVLRHTTDLCVTLHRSRAEIAPTLSSLTTDDGGGDHWEAMEDITTRVHRRPRRELFTPLRVKGSPPARTLTALRVTRGKFVSNGEDFEVVDHWTARATAHMNLGRLWTGSTTFVNKKAL